MTEVLMTLVVRFLALGLGFGTAIVTAKFLGPEGRGVYFYFVSISVVMTQVVSLGYGSSNSYFAAKNKEHIPTLFGNSLAICIASSFMLITFAFFGGEVISGDITSVYLSINVAVSNLAFLLFGAIILGDNRIKEYNIYNAILLSLSFSLISFGCFYFRDINILLFLSSLPGYAVSFLIYSKIKNKNTIKVSYKFFISTVPYSFRVFIVSFLNLMVLRVGVFIISSKMNNEQLGYYSVAFQINEAITILPLAISLVLFPKLFKSKVDPFKLVLKQSIYTGFVLMLVVVGAFYFIEPVFLFVFGEKYSASLPIFYAFLPGALFFGMGSVINQYIAYTGIPWMTIFVWIVVLITTILVTSLLLPVYSSVGAALGLSLSYAIFYIAILTLAWGQARKSLLRKNLP